jgi:hypothetical protein
MTDSFAWLDAEKIRQRYGKATVQVKAEKKGI